MEKIVSVFQHDDQLMPASVKETLDDQVIIFTNRGPYYVQEHLDNEDCIATGTWKTPNGEKYAVDLICDGLGGYEDGQEVSLLAGQELAKIVQERAEKGIQDAHEFVRTWLLNTIEAYEQSWVTKKSGTTFCLSIWTPEQLVMAHIGDSRTQLWDLESNTLFFETKDHKPEGFRNRFKLSAYVHKGNDERVLKALSVKTWDREELPEKLLQLQMTDGFTDNLILSRSDRDCTPIIQRALEESNDDTKGFIKELISEVFGRMEIIGSEEAWDYDAKTDNFSLLSRVIKPREGFSFGNIFTRLFSKQ
jgi:serine/threonine protein phosphatase PrpC